jgi:hypothetical protein
MRWKELVWRSTLCEIERSTVPTTLARTLESHVGTAHTWCGSGGGVDERPADHNLARAPMNPGSSPF